MDLTAWVDVAIGLTVVYLGASLFVTVINEYISQAFNLRGRQLCDSLKALVTDEEVSRILAQSPALKPFFDPTQGGAPSYVDPNLFARLLVGGLAIGASTTDVVSKATATVDKLSASGLKTQLQALIRTAGESGESLVKAVSDWADRSLTMLGEGYKRDLQKISFGIGLVVAIGLNLDTVTLTEHLYSDKDAREAAAALGVQVAERTDKDTFEKCLALTSKERKDDASCAPLAGLVDAVRGRNESLGKLPIGWTERQKRLATAPRWISPKVWGWGSRFVGWMLTALAVSLGAPFWFDLLNKFVNVRHGMRRPEVDQEKAGGT